MHSEIEMHYSTQLSFSILDNNVLNKTDFSKVKYFLTFARRDLI